MQKLHSGWNSPGQNTGVGSLSFLQPEWGFTQPGSLYFIIRSVAIRIWHLCLLLILILSVTLNYSLYTSIQRSLLTFYDVFKTFIFGHSVNAA